MYNITRDRHWSAVVDPITVTHHNSVDTFASTSDQPGGMGRGGKTISQCRLWRQPGFLAQPEVFHHYDSHDREQFGVLM